MWNQIRLDGNTERARRTVASYGLDEELWCINPIDFYDRRFRVLIDRYEAGEDVWVAYLLVSYRHLGLSDREKELWEELAESERKVV